MLTIEEIRAIDFEPRILAYANYLERSYGREVSDRYLQVEYEITFVQRREKLTEQHRLARDVVERAILDILHPDQVPLSAEDIQAKLRGMGLDVAIPKIRNLCSDLVDSNIFRKLRNPWHGKKWVYANARFDSRPQVGDRVMLYKKRSNNKKKPVTFGTVLAFEVERTSNKLFPVVRFERHYGVVNEFADPGAIAVIERKSRV